MLQPRFGIVPLIICALILCASPVVMAENGAPVVQPAQAIMHVTGDVRVNGHPVTNSIVLFAGDVIETGKDSSVSIVKVGKMSFLGPDSRAVFDGNSTVSGSREANVNQSNGRDFFERDDNEKGCKPKPGKGKGREHHCPISDSEDNQD